MTGVNEIREHFLEYFERAGHQRVASGSLVPTNDPTLLFTNAGMVQFKNVFTGAETRPYNRAVTSQKCVRAGGKHNDLDNVGYTARHHTFFEMLGNFSFGDYFKDVAIELAWNLLTKEFGIPSDRLVVTVYADDDEAHELWRKIAGVSGDQLIRISTSDNFWSMGSTGPCGPCSEIFYDHGEQYPGGPPGSPDEDGDRFVEIWNLVFMQFEQMEGGERVPLPRPSIDTGMGLERVAAVLQGTNDNYEIDLMRALIAASEEATGVPACGAHAPSHRVIADHLRASTFLIADGVLPSNEGRGYVLRRVMRRAMRHVELLGVCEPVMWKLVPALVREMGQAFPEITRASSLVTETLKLEEERFRKTLERGLKILEDETQGMGEGDELAGDVAFKLYDTYGFPLDLTQDALRARKISVDQVGFEKAMDVQRKEARAAWSGSGDSATEAVWFKLRDDMEPTEFLGYELEKNDAMIEALVAKGEQCQSLGEGAQGAIIVNQTAFYGESGGQIGDKGVIVNQAGARFRVENTQKKLGDLVVHFGTVEAGSFEAGTPVTLEVDHAARRRVRANHSATHLLHAALREVLGDHVAQKGSLVEPGRLRFDFSHPKAMTEAEIARVENLTNTVVWSNSPVTTQVMAVEDAMAGGAQALFGEKYGDEVRVVAMGKVPGGGEEATFSTELCGGTHVSYTGDVGLVKIVSEQGVASGVRRIEALTTDAAKDYLDMRVNELNLAAGLLKAEPLKITTKIAALVEERRALERSVTELKRKITMGGDAPGGGEETIGSLRIFTRKVDGVAPKDLRGLVDAGKARLGSGVVAIIAVSDDGKAGISVGVTDDLTAQLNAVDLVRLGAVALGGKGGGGRPDMAQAGGPDGAQAEAAFEAIKSRLREAVQAG